MAEIYIPDGTEIVTKEESEVDCGKCVATFYCNSEGTLLRKDIEIIVDPDKLPKMGTVAGAL